MNFGQKSWYLPWYCPFKDRLIYVLKINCSVFKIIFFRFGLTSPTSNGSIKNSPIVAEKVSNPVILYASPQHTSWNEYLKPATHLVVFYANRSENCKRFSPTIDVDTPGVFFFLRWLRRCDTSTLFLGSIEGRFEKSCDKIAQPDCIFIYLYTLFKQKFQFSVAGLNGDLYKTIRINNQI